MTSNLSSRPWLEFVKDLSQEYKSLVVIFDERAVRQNELMSALPDGTLTYSVKGGEDLKTSSQYLDCLQYFLNGGITRDSHMLCIGGGTVSDLGGFVASTILRGISWSVVPTTLLAMVDAAIGGKTGINTSEGKNLVGTFHFPLSVNIDVTFLETLPSAEFDSGMGEVLKYVFLSSDIQKKVKAKVSLEDLIFSCACYKEDVVARDFREANLRKTLNLGHTFGHCLEKVKGISHGLCVAWGLKVIVDLYTSEEMKKDFKEIVNVLKVEIPQVEFSRLEVETMISFLGKDKKRVGSHLISLIIPEKERAVIKDYDLAQVKKDIKGYLSGL